jgi:hypothetical protein
MPKIDVNAVAITRYADVNLVNYTADRGLRFRVGDGLFDRSPCDVSARSPCGARLQHFPKGLAFHP